MQAIMLELDKAMAMDTMEVMVKTISCKKEKMITVVMVDPIEAMDNKHLLMRTSTTTRKNNNNNVHHNTKRRKLAKQLTQIH